MRNERVVFFGTPDFACAILKTLHEENWNVVAAVAQPDKPVGRKHRIEPVPVHALCDEYGIDCIQPEKLRDSVEEVLAYKPDLIVTCAYGQIVPDAILEYPQLGCVNVHPSLLPKYRGGAPMHYAILNGDKETGVSLMEMTHKMDAGRVYAQTRIEIGKDETEEELEKRLMESSVSLIREYLPAYAEGKLAGVVQDEEKVTFCRNIPPEMEQVKFSTEEVHELYNHIRGLIAWPVPYAMIEGKRMKFFKVRMEERETNAVPGTILGYKDKAFEVAAKGGVIRIMEMQPEGRKRMDAVSFYNGAGREYIGKRFD